MTRFVAVVLCAVVTLAVISGNPAKRASPGPNIPAVASMLGLSKLLELVGDAGLVETLSGPGPFTVFGPTNEAFNALPQAIKDYIQDIDNLKGVLTFHVLSGRVLSTDLSNELLVPTVNGKSLRVNVYPEKSPLVATVQCAPIDLNRVDRMATNGVVHVLKQVMIPPMMPIADLLDTSTQFQTLTTALKAAGFFDTLNGEGPFTVFAPTEEAFMKLPEGALNSLLSNITVLQEVLANHVVVGTLCKAGLSSGPVITQQLEVVNINITVEGAVTVDGNNILDKVFSVTNGVVHAIDGVLLPSGH